MKITVVVAANHGFQVIRRLQMARAGHSFGTEFRTWDVAPAEVSRSEVTQPLRSEHQRDRGALQRYHY